MPGEAAPGGLRNPTMLFRGVLPLVGREHELRWLERSIEEALDGAPRVILLVGEPGIGKSALLREVRATSAARGFDTASGRAHEDLPSPGLVFREALSSGFRSEVSERVGPSLVVAEAVVDGSTHLDGVERGDVVRMGVEAMLAAARVRPLAVLLDDVQWADDLSLRLLSHLVFAATEISFRQKLALLIVVASRDLDQGGPSARALARIAREPIAASLGLAGLDSAALDEFVRVLGLARPSRQLVHHLTAATHGNPLFVQHLVDQLSRAGAIRSSHGFLVVEPTIGAFRLPADVREAVAGRLADLDEDCRAVLRWAALLGDPCSLAMLHAVIDKRTDRIESMLETAERSLLIAIDGDEIRFAHPLIRQSLYAGWFGLERTRAHLRAAEVVMRRDGVRTMEADADVARHLIAAGAAAEPATVIEVASRAGRRAFDGCAWSEAARLYRAAIVAAERLVPRLPDGEVARLHARAGEASFRDQDAGPCIEHFSAAADAYRRCGDTAGLGRALAGRMRAEFTLASVAYGTKLDTRELEAASAQLRSETPKLAALLLTDLSQAYWTARDAARATDAAQLALEIGDQLEDDEVRAEAHRSLSLAKGQTLRVREVWEHLVRGVEAARRTGDVWLVSHLCQRVPFSMVWCGDFDAVSRTAQEAAELSRVAHDWGDHSLSRAALVCVAAVCGRLEDAEREARQCMAHVQRSGYPWAGPIWLPALAAARVARGAWSEAEDAIDLLARPGGVFENPGPTIAISAFLLRLLVRMRAGLTPAERQQAVELLSSLPPPQRVDAEDVHAISTYCALVELSAVLGAVANVETFHAILTRARDNGMIVSLGWPFVIARILALSSALLGYDDEALARSKEAIGEAGAIGARAEQGRAALDRARILRDRRDAAAVAEGRTWAISAAQLSAELGMSPLHDESRQLAVELGADPASLPRPAVVAAAAAGLGPLDVAILARLAAERSEGDIASEMMLSPASLGIRIEAIFRALGCRTRREAVDLAQRRGLVALGRRTSLQAPRRLSMRVVMFTDVGGSTALFERLGDIAAYDVQKVHDAIVRDCLSRGGGVEIRHTGDGIMASFDAAAPALECAVEIQRSLERQASHQGKSDLVVRIGLNAGEVISAADDLYGLTVNAAARICAEAQPGQILVGESVQALVSGSPFEVRHHGRMPLKGFTEPFDIFEVCW